MGTNKNKEAYWRYNGGNEKLEYTYLSISVFTLKTFQPSEKHIIVHNL